MKFLILTLIRIYQKTISPNHGILKNYLVYYKCRFYPTCSEYFYQAVKKYGVLKGSIKGTKRILKCHPFNKGGYDPLN